MSREDVLNRIREAEARRRSSAQEARLQKDRMLAEARKEALVILDDAERSAVRAAAQNVHARTGRIAQERRLVMDSGIGQVSLQREKSAARLPAAVDRIFQEFLRSAHD
jgi:vacuolar-type H+-ATPase subunit H